MSSHVKIRKEKGGLAEYESQIKEMRTQISEQLKVVDTQLELKTAQLQDLCDYLRRRGEIEGEYTRSLEKLTERFAAKTKRKEQSDQSVAQCWLVLLSQTRQESKEHGAMSECYSNTLTQRLSHCMEDTQRLAKRSKEVGLQMQEDVLNVATELQMALKTYYQYHTDFLAAEGKLREVTRLDEKQMGKAAELTVSHSGGPRRGTVKKIEKRQGKFQEAQLKCTKARNDYLLSMAAANASLNKHYLQDICTLIDCTDLGYHLSLTRVMRGYLSTRYKAQQNLKEGLQQLDQAVSKLDQIRDRDSLLQAHNATFCLPFLFQYQPHENDQVCEVSAEGQVRYELETRFQQLQSRLAAVVLETDEVSKTLRATHDALLESICDDDCSPGTEHLGTNLPEPAAADGPGGKPSLAKRRANSQETESFYFTKVKEHLSGKSLISKLQVKHDLLKDAIQKAEAINKDASRGNLGRSVRLRKARPCSQYSHKLFGGDMLSFIQSSGQQIPLVVESCIRFINLQGLHHEGIFRVPGSQSKVNLIKDAFERGEDPLTDSECDLDSIAGVLKLYFRGLEKPLFPAESFSQLMECAQIDNDAERAASIRTLVSSFPQPVVVVMRYLFAFLHHVSQYSDENMMQPYNLAVCFGPSLLRGSDTEDMVALQPQVNALVKTMILQHESIFPGLAELPGPVYEKCMTMEQEYCEPAAEEGDGEMEQLTGEEEGDAVAMYDYVARSSAELSFKKGDCIVLHSRASADWWRGEVGGASGLIPDMYINVNVGSLRGKVDQSKVGSTGNLSTDQNQAADQNRLRVNSDCGSVSTKHRGGGSTGPCPRQPEGRQPVSGRAPGGLQQSEAQERKNSIEGLKPVNTAEKKAVQVDKAFSFQMNNVFRELLSRQPAINPSTSASSSSSSGFSSSTSTTQTTQAKGGFVTRGKV